MENKMKANLPKIDQEKLDKIFEIEDLYESGRCRSKRHGSCLPKRLAK